MTTVGFIGSGQNRQCHSGAFIAGGLLLGAVGMIS
jgi:hypothetical protein